MRIALLDSDIIAYKAAILCENDTVYAALALADRITQAWVEIARCDGYVHCLSCGPSFRHKVWPEYKLNRKGKPKPQHLNDVYTHLSQDNCCWHGTLEADDVIGILATYPDCDDQRIVVSIDKDLDQIWGWHCNPDKETLYEVSQDDADFYRWQQVLSGDPADNYPGIPGIGDKKAAKILEYASEGSRYNVVMAMYDAKGLACNFQSMVDCATILTYKKGSICEQSLQDSTEAGTLSGFLQSLKQSSM